MLQSEGTRTCKGRVCVCKLSLLKSQSLSSCFRLSLGFVLSFSEPVARGFPQAGPGGRWPRPHLPISLRWCWCRLQTGLPHEVLLGKVTGKSTFQLRLVGGLLLQGASHHLPSPQAAPPGHCRFLRLHPSSLLPSSHANSQVFVILFIVSSSTTTMNWAPLHVPGTVAAARNLGDREAQ